MADAVKVLSPKQQKAIASMMVCSTIAEAAKHSGIGERTLYRWLKESAFADGLKEAQAEALASAVRMLTSNMGAAAGVIRDTMTDGTPALKLRAALGLIGVLPGLREQVSFEERLAALEAAQDK